MSTNKVSRSTTPSTPNRHNQPDLGHDITSMQFVVHSSPPSTNPRSIRRVYLAANLMRSTKLGAGDLVYITGGKRTAGIAWPSFNIQPEYAQMGSVLCENALVKIGDQVNIEPCKSQVDILSKATFEVNSANVLSNDEIFMLYLREALVDIKYFTADDIFELQYQGRKRHLTFRHEDSENNSKVFTFVRDTDIILTNIEQVKAKKINTNPYANVGGLDKEIEILKDMVELPLLKPEAFHKYGLRPPKGVLLHGPPGTGKTLIAKAVADSTNATVIPINGPEILGKYYGESEAKLREIFMTAQKSSPALIIIDEVDALCPKRQEATNEVERRVVATLLTLMDGMDTDQGVNSRIVVLAATNRPNSIDEALRRPGRFDREIEVAIPDAEARLCILRVLTRKMPHNLSEEDINSLASRSHGYVGADLASMCQHAALLALKRGIDDHVTMSDMEAALAVTRPSAMREIILESPKVYWKDIGGQEVIKQRLKEAIEWPLIHPDAFQRLGVDPPRGMLLYGPPGCSKTLTAKALATESGLNFIAVKGPELFNKYVGESERAVREVFRKARAASPSIIFFDEIDAMTMKRGGEDGVSDRVLAALLNEMDGVEPLKNVIVLAATNRPDVIDPALMRPGRLDRILYVGPPNLEARKEILRIRFAKMKVDDDVDIQKLANETEGCSGAEIVGLCQDAGLEALNESLGSQSISRRHFEKVLNTVQRRITPLMVASYLAFQTQSGFKSA